MTLVNHETGELVEAMSAAEAEVVTDAITWRLDALATTHEEVMPMIREALTRRAWGALGYRSPGEYAAERFGGALTRLSTPVRQAVVQELADVGMSSRAIAPVVGVSDRQVRTDIQVGSASHLPETSGVTPREAGEGATPVATERGAGSTPARGGGGEGILGGTPSSSLPPRPAPSSVVGIDGKTYTRTDPAERIRAAITDFPDLAYYAETGRSNDVIAMADDLRRYRERGELDQRLDTLRRSIAVDRAKRDGTYRPGMTAVMDDDGEYRMAPMSVPAVPTIRTCPTCHGRGSIEE